MHIVVISHVTLDGVMQGPGRPDEDTRDGFTNGGWAAARSDDAVQQAWGERLSRSRADSCFRRRTYEDVLGYWNTQDSPFKDALNQAPKYVASTSHPHPEVAKLNPAHRRHSRRQSPALSPRRATTSTSWAAAPSSKRTQRPAASSTSTCCPIHPIVLGHGRRLFGAGFPPAGIRASPASRATTGTGVVIATYRRSPSAWTPFGDTTPRGELPSTSRPGNGAFVATPAAAGPWSPDAQHGGPPSALAAWVIEQHQAERRPSAWPGSPSTSSAPSRSAS